MATYATLTIPVRDIIGADFNESRASVWIEPNTKVVIADSIRVGGRREQIVNGVATFTQLVTTNSAENLESFGYRVTITAPPKGAQKREDIIALTTADFPLTANANLKDIEEAWDDIAIPVEWRSEFRAEMQALRDEAVDLSGISTPDGVIANRITTPGSATQTALKDTIATEGAARFERRHGGRLRSACTPGATDQTATVQAEVDALAAFGGGELELPGGEIILDGLVMKHRVSLRGAGAFATRVKAKAASTNKAVFLLNSGPVQQAWLSDMRIMPNGNAGQHGIFFKARDASNGFTNPSGWWDGGLRNVQIGDDSAQFAGHGIWLSGGGGTYMAPHQWLTFENVHVAASATGCGLLLSGQVGQLVIINGGFNGRSNNTAVATGASKSGVDIYVAQQLTDAGTNLDATYPYGITVVGTSIQSNGCGVRVEGGNAITLVNPHFEDAAVCLYVTNAYVAMQGGRASGATNTGLTGCVARTGPAGTGRITVTGLTAYGPIDRHWEGFVQAHGNMLGANPKTADMTWQVTPDATGWVNMRDRNTAIINTSANQLKTIESELGTGDTLHLKAHGGAVQIVGSGNINLAGRTSPVTLPSGAVATFVKFDLTGVWFLANTSA